MVSKELLSEIKRLKREDKLCIIQFIEEDLKRDESDPFEGRSHFRLGSLIRASDAAISTLERLEADSAKHG